MTLKPIIALTVCSTLAASSWAKADDILIGAATSFSGWMSAFDTSPTQAAELAVADINAKGGVLGRQLKLVHIDTKTDTALTAKAAQDLVGQHVAMIMTACDFDSGAPAALVAQKAGVLAMSSCGADMKYGDLTIGNNVFTMATDASGTGEIMADWATKKKGFKKAYVLDDTFIEYDKSLCRGFEKHFKELNGPDFIVLEDSFKNADPSVASQVSRYQDLKGGADFMMICSVPPGIGSAIRQFRAAGVDIPILAGTGGDGSAWHESVPGLSNFFYLNYSADDGVAEPRPDSDAFQSSYKAKWGQRPGSGQGITGYSVIEAWARAAQRAGSIDTDKVRAELEKFKDEPLVAGLTTFDAKLHTNVNRPMLIVSINNGKPEPLGYYDMRKGDYAVWWK